MVSGGYGGGDIPVPIPNTAVKPTSADGTWGSPPGRVGRRRDFFERPQLTLGPFARPGGRDPWQRGESPSRCRLGKICVAVLVVVFFSRYFVGVDQYRARRDAASHERGFTLIELLVVVVVIGVLASVVVFNLGGVASQATLSACQADVKTVETAIAAYHAQMGSSPPVSVSLLTQGANPYLLNWPSNSGYTLSMSGGNLYVQTPSDSAPVLASGPGVCAGAGSTTSTTAAVALQPLGTDTSAAGSNTGTLVGAASASSTGHFSGAGSLSLPGTSGSYVSTATLSTGPNTFSLSAWFKTTTTSGGMLVGFGNAQTGVSSTYDRHIYMTNAGNIVFGVYPNYVVAIQSPLTYNDGNWHQVVATLSSAGMYLYIDGGLVASNSTTTGQGFNGYWRLGGDNLAGWPNRPSSDYFSGNLSDVAVYPSALDATQVASIARATSYSTESAAVLALNPSSYWPLDGP